MIALGQKDPEWDVRSDIWSLACTVSQSHPPYALINFDFDSLTRDLRNFRWMYYVPPCGGWYWVDMCHGATSWTVAASMGLILGLK